MCEFCDSFHANQALSYFDSYPERVITSQVIARFPYAFQEGCYPVCGRYLENWERSPLYRATRCMCKEDYEALIVNNITEYCFICGGLLPFSKVDAQHGRPREVKNHIHEGECIHRWTVIHNVSVGKPNFVSVFGRRPEIPRPSLPAPDHQALLSEGCNRSSLAPRREPIALSVSGRFDAVPRKLIYRGKVIKRIR